MGLRAMLAAIAIGAKLLSTDPALAEQPTEPVRQEQPAQNPINLANRTDLFSLFNFRGFQNSEDYVIQLNPSATYGNASLIGFVNYDGATGKVNETDATFDFTNQFGKLLLSVGYTYLSFPNTEVNNSQEIYAIASLDTFLKPSIAVFHDFDDVKGDYIPFSVSHDFDVNGQPISLTGRINYNNHFLREASGFSNWEASVAMPVSLTSKITVTPSINYTHAIDRTDFEDFVYFGVSIDGVVEYGQD